MIRRHTSELIFASPDSQSPAPLSGPQCEQAASLTRQDEGPEGEAGMGDPAGGDVEEVNEDHWRVLVGQAASREGGGEEGNGEESAWNTRTRKAMRKQLKPKAQRLNFSQIM